MSTKKRPKLRLFSLILTLTLLLFLLPAKAVTEWPVSVEYGFSMVPDDGRPETFFVAGEEVAIWGEPQMLPVYDESLYGCIFDTWMTPAGEEENLRLLDDVSAQYATFTMPDWPVNFIAHFEWIERPGEPIITAIVGHENGMTIYWDPPLYGAEPTGYFLMDGYDVYELPADAGSYSIDDMINGETYWISIYATHRGIDGYEASQEATAGPVYEEPELPVPTEIETVPTETETEPTETESLPPLASFINLDDLKSVRNELIIPSRFIDLTGLASDDEDDSPDFRNMLRVKPWLTGNWLLDFYRIKGEPRDVTLQLIDKTTGEVVHGGSDLYLSTEGEGGVYTAEIFPNDAEHNPIVRELKPGVRYRFGQMPPAPDGYAIPDDYLFYIDNNGRVWDALLHKEITLSGPNTVTIETEPGFDVICSVRSSLDTANELPNVPLEVSFPSKYNTIPEYENSTYWHSGTEPMTISVRYGDECTYKLNEPMPGYKTPEPIHFRIIFDAGLNQNVLQIRQGEDWIGFEGNMIVLELEPDVKMPVRFSVVDQGTEQEVNGFTAYIINNWMARVDYVWQTDEYPDGREIMLAPGDYTFNATHGPLEYAGIVCRHFRMDSDGKIFFRESPDGPWTERPDNLIRLEAFKGQIVTIHTIADDLGQLPDVIFSLIGDNGAHQSFVSGSDPIQVAVIPDLLYVAEVYINPWPDLITPDKIYLKVDSAGQLFIGSAADQLTAVDGYDIILEFEWVEEPQVLG
jgi:hypothetical protein